MTVIAGKTVVITGASRGLGFEFVKQFAAKGNRVIAACRSPDAVKKQLEGLGDVAVTQLDVSSPASIEDFADAVQQLTPHVDVVVNNAGTNGGSWGITLETLTAEHLMNVFNVNAIGPLLVVQQLRRRGLLGGKAPTTVANITSKMGSIDDNTSGGSYAYRTSKASLNIITKSLSIDLAGENVTSTLLHPGWVVTDMTNHSGLINTEQSVAGMISVLESGKDLQGTWHAYDGKVIPW